MGDRGQDMYLGECSECDKGIYESTPARGIAHTDIFYCIECWNNINQPERLSELASKEDAIV